MECDSMHSSIELEKKWVDDVYSMLNWRTRRKNQYKVLNLEHEQFLNFQELAQSIIKNRNKDKNGNAVAVDKINEVHKI